MRIAITGSSGYLGRRLVALLAAQPQVESILGVDIAPPPTANSPSNFQFINHDISRPFADVFQSHSVTKAVHLAFIFGPTRRKRLAKAVNLGGTRNFLDACRVANVSRALVVGSAIAYGARRDNPPLLDEFAPLRAGPGFIYAHHKRLCDEMCRDFGRENPRARLAVLRPPIVLGRQVDNYFSRMFFKPKVVYPRWGDPAMQFVHEEDVAAAIAALLACDAPGPFNMAPQGTIRFSELAWECKRAAFGMPYPILWAISACTYAARLSGLNETPPGALAYIRYPWLVNGDRLLRETGYSPARSTIESVRDWREGVRKMAMTGAEMPGKYRR